MILVSLAVIALFTVKIAPAAGALSMKACQLVTAKDVQSVLGGGYRQEDLLSNPQMSICGYTRSKDEIVTVSLKLEIVDVALVLKESGKSSSSRE